MIGKSLSLRVLHIDDDPFELDRVRTALEKHATACSFQVESLSDEESFRKRLHKSPNPDIVILDINLSGAESSGVELAAETRRVLPNAAIIMCSTADDVATIAESLSSGADDFISKESDHGELNLRIFNSYRLAMLKGGKEPSSAQKTPLDTKAFVGRSMMRIAARVPLLMNSAVSAVFIRGESGTGKEVVANLFASQLKKDQPFIKVNCGAIAPTLLESELFGHIKGAFTGAIAEKKGLLEASSGGWIFLDEVATLSPSAQVALLRVLENGELVKVGATKPIAIQIRVISATNESMEDLIKAGKFRADLWQRLRETEVYLPPLRERPDEIPLLIEHFCQTMPGGPYQVSQPALDVLSHASWSEGNIRELRNVLRAMTEMHVDKLLTPIAIPQRIWEEMGEAPTGIKSQGQPPSMEAKVEETGSFESPQKPLPQAPVASTSRSKNPLTIPWPLDGTPHFDDLSDILLVAVVRRIVSEDGKISLRSLAQRIGLSRSTLSTRLKGAVHKNIIPLEELTGLVGISDL